MNMETLLPVPRRRGKLPFGFAFLVVVALVVSACGEGAGDDAETEGPDDGQGADQVLSDGDEVRIIVTRSAGGGFDLQARMLAPYLDTAFNDLAGADVNVVVQNISGADTQIGNYAAYSSDPDELVMVFTPLETSVQNELFLGADYRMLELTPLGMYAPPASAIVIRSDVELPQPGFMGLVERSQSEPVLFGQTIGVPVLIVLRELLAREEVEFNFDLVNLDGTSEVMAALLRGDVEIGTSAATGMLPIVEDNPEELEFLVSFGCERDPIIPDVEVLADQGVPAADEICAAMAGPRSWFGPPGMPEATADLFRRALEQAMSDPEHVAESLEAGFDATYVDAERQRQIHESMVDSFESFRDVIEEETQ